MDVHKLVYKSDIVPLPKSPKWDDILSALVRVFSKPHVKHVEIDTEVGVKVEWVGLPDDAIPGEAQVKVRAIEELLAVINMEGVDATDSRSALTSAVLEMEQEGLFHTHLLVSEHSKLWTSLKVDKTARVLGGKVLTYPGLADDVALALGGRTALAKITEAQKAFRIYLNTEETAKV